MSKSDPFGVEEAISKKDSKKLTGAHPGSATYNRVVGRHNRMKNPAGNSRRQNAKDNAVQGAKYGGLGLGAAQAIAVPSTKLRGVAAAGAVGAAGGAALGAHVGYNRRPYKNGKLKKK